MFQNKLIHKYINKQKHFVIRIKPTSYFRTEIRIVVSVSDEKKWLFLRGGVTAREEYFSHFAPSQSLGGAKTGDTEKNHLTTRLSHLSEAGTHDGEMMSDLER